MKHAAIMPLLGGLTIGAAQALNSEPKCIVDLHKPGEPTFGDAHSSTLRRYWPGVPYHVVEVGQEKRHTQQVDVTTSVPPCGGMSMQSKKRGADMEINEWMTHTMVVALTMFNPRVHVMENAITLSTTMGEPLRDKLMQAAMKLGYEVTFIKVNTANHGLPQRRRRTFMLCWRAGARLIDDPRRGRPPRLVDFLGDKVRAGRPHAEDECWDEPYNDCAMVRWATDVWGRAWRLCGTKWNRNNLITVAIKSGYGKALEAWLNFQSLKSGKRGESAIRWLKHIRHANECIAAGKEFYIPQVVFPREITSTCISSALGRWVHPDYNRFLYVREVMDLMGLPDDMELALSDGARFEHIIQNVPTNTSKDIVKAAVKALNNNNLCNNGTVQDYSRLYWLPTGIK